MQSPENARKIAESLVERGIAGGATAADALYAGDRSSGVQVRLGQLEDVSRSEGEQIGLMESTKVDPHGCSTARVQRR